MDGRVICCALVIICVNGTTGEGRAQTPDLGCGLSIPCRLPSSRLARALAKEVNFAGITDPETTLQDALEKIADSHDIAFDLMEDAFAVEGIDDVLKLKIAERPLPRMEKVPLKAVVLAIVERIPVRSGTTFYLVRDQLLITTKAHATLHSWAELKDETGQFVRESARFVGFLTSLDPDFPDHLRDIGALSALVAHWHTVLVDNYIGVSNAHFNRDGLSRLRRSCGFRP
jgi:hypothetical protein